MSPARGLIAVLLYAATFPLAADGYTLGGEIGIEAAAAHRVDSPVVIDPAERGTWASAGALDARFLHTWSSGPVVLRVDHRLVVRPGSPDEIASGTGGLGYSEPAPVLMRHTLTRANVEMNTAGWLGVSLGRQRIEWGMRGAFAPGDVIHPASSDRRIEPGFDGAALRLGDRSASLIGVVAIQDALRTGDFRDLRVATAATLRDELIELSVGATWQFETTLRPGAGVALLVGDQRAFVDGYLEIYNPRARRIELQPVAEVGYRGSTELGTGRLESTVAYLYNGLAPAVPATTDPTYAVTTDLAGGFSRPGLAYALAHLEWNSAAWSAGTGARVNLTDLSAIVRHTLRISVASAVSVDLAVEWRVAEAIIDQFGRSSEDFTVELGARFRL